MLSESARLIAEGAGAAAALGLAAGGWIYAARYPQSQIFGPTLIAPERIGEIALTFDDGPNPAWTPKLIDMLAAHRVKATFFLMGKYVDAEPYLTRHIVESGHIIGNHSWSHPNLAFAGRKRIREELYSTKHMLEQITGSRVRYFRPPFGARRPFVLNEARELGMSPVLWNAMTNDWEEPAAEVIAERLGDKVDALGRRGRSATIVLHDGGHLEPAADRGPSVAAAEMLIKRFIGVRRFVTAEYLQWGPKPVSVRAR
jgi:peptidoglycan/xylan/chitin deacetylase (PgdA/CDA1 family)